MKQTTLQKSHYEIHGHRFNPCYENDCNGDYFCEEETLSMTATSKKQVVGAVAILVDQDCEHIDIFFVRGVEK